MTKSVLLSKFKRIFKWNYLLIKSNIIFLNGYTYKKSKQSKI